MADRSHPAEATKACVMLRLVSSLAGVDRSRKTSSQTQPRRDFYQQLLRQPYHRLPLLSVLGRMVRFSVFGMVFLLCQQFGQEPCSSGGD
jgi:hypothetical protein